MECLQLEKLEICAIVQATVEDVDIVILFCFLSLSGVFRNLCQYKELVISCRYQECSRICTIIWTTCKCAVVRASYFCCYREYMDMCQYMTFLLLTVVGSISGFMLLLGQHMNTLLYRLFWEFVPLFWETCGYLPIQGFFVFIVDIKKNFHYRSYFAIIRAINSFIYFLMFDGKGMPRQTDICHGS